MAGSYVEAIARAAQDAQSLVRFLDGLDEHAPATPAAIGHAAQLADAVERVVYQALQEAYPDWSAKAAADQALESIDAFRAAAQGNDVRLMRAAARGALDHLNRARELEEPAP
ncbi:MAG TPA: hypothetical protein PLY56_03870 [Armatimonadota bacterium]|jgi:hypothetical protein|nr:hypothetical protein [Armatimonadota bacterium]HOM82231.1 hypothetical protein [Armatimonadota bacterium]HPO74314.1 hypothetical protein [Armatimonadota bacterium]